MAGIIGRSQRHSRNRRRNPEANKPQPVTPIYILGSAKAGAVLTLTFDQSVTVAGVPRFSFVNLPLVTPVNAVLVAPNQVAITFSGAITTGTSLNVGFRDPGIRSASGGFVTSNLVALAA